MVTFNCEACNDTVIKKKLDQHKNQCWNAQFTCIDCNTTFNGTDYRAHTSCITEAQKYQGKLYRPEKQKGKQNNRNQRQNGQTNGYTPGTSTNSIAVTPRVFGQNKNSAPEETASTEAAVAPVLTTPTGSRLKKDGMPSSPIKKNVVFAYPIKEERVFDKNVPMTVTPVKKAAEAVEESPKIKDVVVSKDEVSEKKDDKKDYKSEKKEKKKEKKAEKKEKKEEKKVEKKEKKAEKKEKKADKKEEKKDKKRKHDDSSDEETPATPSKKVKDNTVVPPILKKAFEAVKDDGSKNSLKDFMKAISADGKKTKKEILSGFAVSKRKVGDKEEIVLTPLA